MGCLPRPKMFRKRRKEKASRPNVVSRFFVGVFYVLSSCIFDNNRTQHNVDQDSRKHIAKRIVKRNKILYTAEYDEPEGAGPSGSNIDKDSNSSGPAINEGDIAVENSSQGDEDKSGKDTNNKEPSPLETAEAIEREKAAEKNKKSLFMDMFGEFGKSKFPIFR